MRGPTRLLATLATVLISASASAAHGERLLDRVAEVRATRTTARDGLLSRCATHVLVEAYQALPELSAADRAPLAMLLDPPPDLAYWVEADAPFPVRVSYADEALAGKAAQILEAVAIAYQREVVEWGFWPPLVEPGTEPYRFYLMDAGGAAGYTSPYRENDATPHADAFTYIVIDPSLDGIQLDATVAHELNHASQVAMDAAEVRSFLENTASYIEIPVFPASKPYAVSMFPFFQKQPHRTLEYFVPTGTDGYEYGGGLWPLFLVYRYGEDDPRWIRRVWEGTVQDGNVNEPDYFDAIDALLADEGGIAEAVKSFQRYRFFVGALADGQHLPDAEHWGGAEVALTADWKASQLPVLDAAAPDPDTRPQPNGCNYVMMTPDPASEVPLRFSFDGHPTTSWDVSVLEMGQGLDTRQTAISLEEGAGKIDVGTQTLDRIALAICQAGGVDHDPDGSVLGGADYRYSIQQALPPPVVDTVTPRAIPVGAHDAEVTIVGEGFGSGDGLRVELGGNRVVVSRLERISSEELTVRVSVAPGAELGPRDVTVTNPGGDVATAAGALMIVEEPVDVAPATDAGCACGTSPSASSRGAWLLAALALGVRRRRRAVAAAAVVGCALLGAPGVASAEPPASDGFVESSSVPVRVYYTNAVGQEVAEAALAIAETSWITQVDGMGFPTPHTLDDDGNIVEGLWIYLDPTAPYNHAEILGDNPDTPWTDCTVQSIVAATVVNDYLETVVDHEMNHALQMSADCGESFFMFESTSMATTQITGTDSLFVEMLPHFQQNPQNGFDCAFFGDAKKPYFHYGAGLFPLFLENRYGDYDGRLIAAIWDAAKQNGTVTSVAGGFAEIDVDNDPNGMAAIDAALGDVTIDEAFVEFAQWRYFVGGRDDGHHFKQATEWAGSELAIDTELTLGALPLSAAVPQRLLNPYGSSYISLSLHDLPKDKGILLGVTGNPSTRWHADVLVLRDGEAAEVRAVALENDAAGELVVDELEGATAIVLVMSNISDGSHDPDTGACYGQAGYTFNLALADVALAPRVDSINPPELRRGETTFVWLAGTDFVEGLNIAVSGGGVVVGEITYVDATAVGVALTVDDGAKTGRRDVLVTNPNGLSTTMSAGITILDEGSSDASCACAVPGRAGGSSGPWVALLLGLVLAARRRSLQRVGTVSSS